MTVRLIYLVQVPPFFFSHFHPLKAASDARTFLTPSLASFLTVGKESGERLYIPSHTHTLNEYGLWALTEDSMFRGIINS
jgi:hypothetical protein